MSFAELAAVAAVGTGKRPLPRLDLGLPTYDPDEPTALPAQLLDAAAALAVVRRGAVPPARPVPVTAAGPETLPEPPEDFVTALAGLRVEGAVRAASDRAELLVEALGWMHQAGYRLPHRLLVGLVDHTDPRVRRAAQRVAGERGRWLLEQLQEEPAEPAVVGIDDWRLGTTSQRVAYLRQELGHDRAAARALLQADWLASPAAVRETFLGVLSESLDPGDEDFLESCLDDRSRRVREEAVRSLVRLPGSAYRERMGPRLAQVLQLDLNRRKVALALPKADQQMRRDGFAATEPPAALRWVLAAVPPADYARWLGVETRDWLGFRGAKQVRGALVRAAVAWEDADLAAALVEVGHRDLDLLRAAPGETLVDLVGQVKRSELVWSLHRLPRPWSDELVAAVYPVLQRPVTQRDPFPYELVALLALAVRVDAAGVWAWRVRELADQVKVPDQTRYRVLQAASLLTVRDTLWTSLQRGRR